MGILDRLKSSIPKIETTQPREVPAQIDDSDSQNLKPTKEEKNLSKALDRINKDINDRQEYLAQLLSEIKVAEKELVVTKDEILYQSFGLYQPLYNFNNSEEYKKRLDLERDRQKFLIKSNKAITGNKDWLVNGSKVEGKKIVSDIQKLLLRAFNNECDDVIGKVRFSNMEQSIKRIRNSFDSVSKLGRVMNLSITEEYYVSKIRELRIAHEYAEKKEEEKEQLKEMREQAREDAKLQQEIAEERRRIQKEQTHYENALSQLVTQLDHAEGDAKEEIIARISEIKRTLSDINKNMEDIDYRESNQRAGYVYVISNIGAFGEKVFKIGMTRRLNPQERIDELSNASVPFNFDIHAMIFSDDAPKLEAALHRRFEDRKLNMVNLRREFFYASIEEIKEVIRENYTKAVDFIDIPEAEQYRVSLKMKEVENA